jgi:hypothetical protein
MSDEEDAAMAVDAPAAPAAQNNKGKGKASAAAAADETANQPWVRAPRRRACARTRRVSRVRARSRRRWRNAQVEKYRPKSLDDVVAHKEIVDTSARPSCTRGLHTRACAAASADNPTALAFFPPTPLRRAAPPQSRG